MPSLAACSSSTRLSVCFAGVGRTGWHIDGSFQTAPFSHALYHIVSCPTKGATGGAAGRAAAERAGGGVGLKQGLRPGGRARAAEHTALPTAELHRRTHPALWQCLRRCMRWWPACRRSSGRAGTDSGCSATGEPGGSQHTAGWVRLLCGRTCWVCRGVAPTDIALLAATCCCPAHLPQGRQAAAVSCGDLHWGLRLQAACWAPPPPFCAIAPGPLGPFSFLLRPWCHALRCIQQSCCFRCRCRKLQVPAPAHGPGCTVLPPG